MEKAIHFIIKIYDGIISFVCYKYFYLSLTFIRVHIRRGDKIKPGKAREAIYHDDDEYILHVQNYYHSLYLKGYDGPKRVFIASDSIDNIENMRKKFPNYTFIDSNCIAYKTNLSDVERQWGPIRIISALLDVHLLANTDYIICTMSSNVSTKSL